MTLHFLFEPGEWLGAGQVSFSISPDVLYFRTKWSIAKQESSSFYCTQVVEIVGGDRIVNVFVVTPENASAFQITLENELLGTFVGQGVQDDSCVAWEFRNRGSFEGYEVYERLQELEYTMRAEYLSSDARTMIRGRIWKRQSHLDDHFMESSSPEQ